MITASEPLEFIPRGREAVEEHPGPLVSKKHNFINDHALLQRLQNVNISKEAENTSEYWRIREVYKEISFSTYKNKTTPNSRSGSPNFLNEYYVNAEEELYFKGHTAVWSKSSETGNQSGERICLTCESPIKFAFFCTTSFIQSETTDLEIKKKPIGICLLDSTCLKVYRNDGENFVTTIETPISNIWSSKYCILMEKESSSTTLIAESIPMPRLFSLGHPLDEMRPILIKTNIVKYLTESDYKIIYTSEEHDLIFMYDSSTGKHLVCRLRKASTEETQHVNKTNNNYNSTINVSSNLNLHNITAHNTMKLSMLAKHNASLHKSNLTGPSPLSEKNMPMGSASFNTSRPTTPLSRLQSTLGQSRSVMDFRKLDQTEPAKTIVPEYCLEQIWSDNYNSSKEFHQCASTAFFHTDLIGQTYLCYLFPRSYVLNLSRLEKSNPSENQIFGMVTSIQAKDAIPLRRMNMLAILAPCGTLMLYTGPCLVGKVHVAGILTSLISSSNFGNSFNSTFPRRSSLLPTISSSTDSKFDDDLHLLSPVPPLHPQNPGKLTNCESIRDPAGNRITLVFNGGRMYRVSLPWICKSTLVSKCLLVLKQVLAKDVAVNFFIKWYGVRNVPGSQDYSPQQEWDIFEKVLCESIGRSVIGYNGDQSSNSSVNKSQSPKKRRKSESNHGTDADWMYLLANDSPHLNLKHSNRETVAECAYISSAQLFNFIPMLMYSFHLLYEELKLDITLQSELMLFANLLYQMALDLKLENYRLHYFLDFPHLISHKTNNFIDSKDFAKLHNTQLMKTDIMPNIFKYIKQIIENSESLSDPYPYIKQVNPMSKNIIQLVYLIVNQRKVELDVCIKRIVIPGLVNPEKKAKSTKSKKLSLAEEIIQMMLKKNITRSVMEKLPVGIHMILSQVLERSRTLPPIGCDPEVYELLLRPDLVAHAIFPRIEEKYDNISQYSPQKDNSLSSRVQIQPDVLPKADKAVEESGMENIDTKLLRLRFPDDLRINDVQAYLNSSQPVQIDIVQSPNVSDHEFIEEQEKQLYALCTRTMALPIGRGMFTLRTNNPSSTESLSMPKLCLSGKEVERGATIELQQIEVPPNMNMWPLFHNGVAAGLRITSDAKDIDSTWITYNKPKASGTTEVPTEHAGFLMALGLNKHLACLSFMSVYDYLVKCDEMTSVGLLLGISATYIGTMDMNTTKLLSVHMEALLPPTAVELDIPQNIQVASLMGIGLLYQGTAKRHIAEVLLQEIGRPPGPEMENYVERESYALTAGLALGLVTLGQGDLSTGLKDLTLPDTLHYYMIGGNKRPLTGAQKEKYKLPSFQIREGETVNIDVTAPGATLALGLMFFQTNNEAVANWMKPPDTKYLLDFIRPDLLLLRIIARGLITWDTIDASTEWVYSQVPPHLAEIIKQRPDLNDTNDSDDMDHESNCQAYCNIITGAAFCIGLRYAGTENPMAYHTLKKIIDLFLNVTGHYISEFAGKPTVESCLIMVLLSISLVFAGTGDLGILRLIRMMRARIGQSNNHVTYGSHMAIHMALGFLFLGAGRFSLSRSPLAIAALVCSLFPKFPMHSNDNRYHLQAFRHLYVLAIEPRLFLPRDIDSGKLCLCKLHYTKLNSNKNFTVMAPCLLPELDTLDRVYVDDENYWPIHFQRTRNWKQLIDILNLHGCVDIKKRAGCLSHLDDPHRLKSIFVQTLTTEQFNSWKIDLKSLLTFSNDEVILCLIRKYLKTTTDLSVADGTSGLSNENSLIHTLILQVYNCLTKDKMHALPIYVSLLMNLRNLNKSSSCTDIWQIGIVASIFRKQLNETNKNNSLLFSSELLKSLISRFLTEMERKLNAHRQLLAQYVLSGNLNNFTDCSLDQLTALSSLIVYYNLPSNLTNNSEHQLNYLQIVYELKKLNKYMETETINSIVKTLFHK